MRILQSLLKTRSALSSSYSFSTSATSYGSIEKKICIVGAGPAGFYAAQYLLKHLPNCSIDVIERLPVPFGLVRFGVAPDHPEVKNVINTFTKTAEHPKFNFFGNLSLGSDVTLKELRERYHAVLLTYGAERDRKLNIPNETESKNILSAREFVAWYNGLPGAENLNPDLSGKNVALIGQGNVAIDVARILLSPLDKLKETDITEYALEALTRSKVEKVYLVGRRGPLQAAFTIKELREMLKLPNVSTLWREEDFKGVPEVIPSLQRPRKRITELMLTSLQAQKSASNISNKQFLPIFLRSPKNILGNQLELTVNELKENAAVPTAASETLPSDLILRSIGYQSTCVDPEINFDQKKGLICNKAGRVICKDPSNNPEPGLYVAGWLGTGPTGVILTTMNGAFAVARTICEDFEANKIAHDEQKPGLDTTGKRIVTWKGWQQIDKAEEAEGKKHGKPREKIVHVDEMLKVAGV
ncbi:unnamed protein product [Hermetia illucens]|uniref:NADPH:adrenodoxin oxidoreductase, mitochondrial n=1 Tax=Hermetia illucens TaxID=343691 RepID=A0A7R8UBH9_HERIL|nr:NADPH:adrenodoxin oxidoreductase, mitochondrial [Hermetia illucens]CAD7076894.1 unnamed protein product [Hermetia illucens]